MAKVNIDAEEDELEKQWQQILWYAAFLAIDESRSMFGIDGASFRQDIARALQTIIEEYASAASASATSAWKAKYSEIIQDAIRRGLSPAEAEANLKNASVAMGGKLRSLTHDNIMNAFRSAIAEIGRQSGIQMERYEAMPGADNICLPYNGKIFKTGTGPIPPLHQNCRCLRFPVGGA